MLIKTRCCKLIAGVIACVLSTLLLIDPVLATGLPATGQTVCYDDATITDCTNGGYPRQDGSTAGTLSYDKIDATGSVIAPAATEWNCVRDNATGLVWENKTNDGGKRDQRHRYAWHDPLTETNGGNAGGTTDTAVCAESLNGLACTTKNYIDAVNVMNLCGAGDWRLPTQRELSTLVHAGALKPTIDVAFFSNTANDVYWSATTYSRTSAFAWGVHFGYGASNADYKTQPYAVRLVRGTPF